MHSPKYDSPDRVAIFFVLLFLLNSALAYALYSKDHLLGSVLLFLSFPVSFPPIYWAISFALGLGFWGKLADAVQWWYELFDLPV